MAAARPTYETKVFDQSMWNTDGSDIVTDRCGHKHRTISGAVRCHANLTRRNADGTMSARWYHAIVGRTDDKTMTREERIERDWQFELLERQ